MATRARPTESIGTAPMREFLGWVGWRPRTYAETMEAWASHCPRFTLWEDALAAGLIHIQAHPGAPIDQAAVALTPSGQAALREN
jgi:hypothetical protein